VAGIILAAGASRRFGGADKLLVPIDGVALVRRVANVLFASQVSPVIAVVAPDRPAIVAELEAAGSQWIENPAAAAGLGTSIAVGICAVPASTDGALIVPGDMAGLTSTFVDRLIAVFVAGQGQSVVYPVTSSGEQRNPVLWPRHLFHRLAALGGEAGGKSILADPALNRVPVAADDERQLEDIDTPQDLAAYLARR